jgi:hypothetical protein
MPRRSRKPAAEHLTAAARLETYAPFFLAMLLRQRGLAGL